ncbi:MAG: thermonuclease family protein, partial [Spartobacteria bacterium]
MDLLLLLGIFFGSTLKADEWQTLKNCRLIENDANDGDSFHIDHDGKEYLFRLYFVDAAESAEDSTLENRIDEQAEHFGVSTKDLIEGGVNAKEFTKKTLKKPFTVITKFQDAMGRSKMQRHYAIVLPEDGGTDLAEMLIRAGLARAHGEVPSKPP